MRMTARSAKEAKNCTAAVIAVVVSGSTVAAKVISKDILRKRKKIAEIEGCLGRKELLPVMLGLLSGWSWGYPISLGDSRGVASRGGGR